MAETRQKNFPEARRLFMKALALNPRHVPAIGGLAHAEFQAGELRSARNLYARALQVADLPSDMPSVEGRPLCLAYASSATPYTWLAGESKPCEDTLCACHIGAAQQSPQGC